ncbi:hypothetical protein FOA52_003802 [Chlamydomonas sp. UWO 241]|nr:hypothetical protein FOA52_003802 [Chlamydomonas sp. UWO 241]
MQRSLLPTLGSLAEHGARDEAEGVAVDPYRMSMSGTSLFNNLDMHKIQKSKLHAQLTAAGLTGVGGISATSRPASTTLPAMSSPVRYHALGGGAPDSLPAIVAARGSASPGGSDGDGYGGAWGSVPARGASVCGGGGGGGAAASAGGPGGAVRCASIAASSVLTSSPPPASYAPRASLGGGPNGHHARAHAASLVSSPRGGPPSACHSTMSVALGDAHPHDQQHGGAEGGMPGTVPSADLPDPWWTEQGSPGGRGRRSVSSEASRTRLEEKMKELSGGMLHSLSRSTTSVSVVQQPGVIEKAPSLAHLSGVELSSIAMRAVYEAANVLDRLTAGATIEALTAAAAASAARASSSGPAPGSEGGAAALSRTAAPSKRHNAWSRLKAGGIAGGRAAAGGAGGRTSGEFAADRLNHMLHGHVGDAMMELADHVSFENAAKERAQVMEVSIFESSRNIEAAAAREAMEARLVGNTRRAAQLKEQATASAAQPPPAAGVGPAAAAAAAAAPAAAAGAAAGTGPAAAATATAAAAAAGRGPAAAAAAAAAAAGTGPAAAAATSTAAAATGTSPAAAAAAAVAVGTGSATAVTDGGTMEAAASDSVGFAAAAAAAAATSGGASGGGAAGAAGAAAPAGNAASAAAAASSSSASSSSSAAASAPSSVMVSVSSSAPSTAAPSRLGSGSQPEGWLDGRDSPVCGEQSTKTPIGRDGEMFTGAYGRVHNLNQKLLDCKLGIVRSNPEAFEATRAAQAEADMRQQTQRAQARFKVATDALMEPKTVERFMGAVTAVHSERPFFRGPVHGPRAVTARAKVAAEQKQEEAVKVWTLETSVFWQRRKESQCRSVWDTDAAKETMFQLDWKRIAEKKNFRKLVNRIDEGVRVSNTGDSLEEELAEIREELASRKDEIRTIFSYYSAVIGVTTLKSDSMFTLSMNGWLQFCSLTGITDNTRRGCSSSDLQNVFVAVNYEEEQGTQESEANDDDEMMRFEFLEGIVRAAFGKYIVTKEMDDASDAVARFLNDDLIAAVPPEALLDPNAFRQSSMYTEALEVVLLQHWDMLNACFKIYKAKDRTKHFTVEHWAAFLDGAGLLSHHTGLTKTMVKLLYVLAQGIVSDELNRRKIAISLRFFDFVEAICRVADSLSPPSLDELAALYADNELVKSHAAHPLALYCGVPLKDCKDMPEDGRAGRLTDGGGRAVRQRSSQPSPGPGDVLPAPSTLVPGDRRESGGILGAPTRPLEVKFACVMDYVVFNMKAAWGGKTEADCVGRMTRMTTTISGGIERN